MQTRRPRSSKQVTGQQFIRKLNACYRQYLRETHWNRDNFDEGDSRYQLVERLINAKLQGYTVVNLDFAQIPQNFSALSGVMFNRILFKNAKNVTDRVQCEACIFDECQFVHDAAQLGYFNDCIMFSGDEWLMRELNGGEHGSVVINRANRKPLVALVYAPSHGVGYCDEMVDILQQQGLAVLRLYSRYFNFDEDHKPDHPITNYLRYVDGFYLPGGMDVITDESQYTFREKLEHYLVEQSLKVRMPTIAVCRGHQFVGHYFGATIRDVHEDHLENYHDESDVRILEDNTRLYALAAKIARRHVVVSGPLASTLSQRDDGYHYEGYCAHEQGVFFANGMPHRVKAAAVTPDGLVESMEVGGHILTFQHHHEAKYEEDAFSRAVIRHFVGMVKDYHRFKESRAITRSQAALFGVKRKRDEQDIVSLENKAPRVSGAASVGR